jgi:hypothetical protein
VKSISSGGVVLDNRKTRYYKFSRDLKCQGVALMQGSQQASSKFPLKTESVNGDGKKARSMYVTNLGPQEMLLLQCFFDCMISNVSSRVAWGGSKEDYASREGAAFFLAKLRDLLIDS